MYTPDKWVVLRLINKDEVQFKILAGWSSGYLYGDSWRLNSGIVKVENDGDFILFHGESGSVYRCHKESYGLSMATSGVFKEFKDAFGDAVEIVSHTTSWIHLV